MSVVKDVDLETMPTSIFLNDDEDDISERWLPEYVFLAAPCV